MLLRDRWDGRETLFEGDRELVLRHLPADARILAARATVTPVDLTDGRDPFVETLLFGTADARGATKTAVSGAVEVDLHARRTLAGIQGSGVSGATLLIDLGGAFVAVDKNGAVNGTAGSPVQGNSSSLPGVATSRFRLALAGSPDVSAVRVRSVPANLSLSLRGQPTFWFVPGELTGPRTTPDFAAALQAFLPEAEVKDGYFLLPFVLHADGIARLAVEIEIEYLRSASVLPPGLAEATLPFDAGSLPTESTALKVSLPAGSVVVRGASLGRALGGFAATRVAFGPTGEVAAPAAVDLPTGTSLAQIFKLSAAVEAVAVDLLLAAPRAARLQIDLRQDLDGKPGERSLLPSPVGFTFDPGEAAGRAAWTSVPLARPFSIAPAVSVWLLLQSLDGEAVWKAAPAAASSPGLQRTLDGGLSWRIAAPGAPLAALLRLREQPAEFRLPVELQVGTGEQVQRVSLRRFDPLRRVELPFAVPEIEDAFDRHLAAAGPAGCPRGDHLANGDFEDWIKVGDALGGISFVELSPNSNGTLAVAVSPDGRRAYTVESLGEGSSGLRAVDLACDRPSGELLRLDGDFHALAIHPAGSRAYVLSSDRLQVVDLAGPHLLGQAVVLPASLRSLAVSRDGGRLFLGFSVTATAGGFGQPGGNIAAFDTARLEEVALGGGLFPAALAGPVLSLGSGRDPVALAAARDGSLLWALATDHQSSKAELLPVETSLRRVLQSKSVALDFAGQHLALTPDGATALVTAFGTSPTKVVLVDLASRQKETLGAEEAGPIAVAPDGRRAFVGIEGDLQVIDLGRRAYGVRLEVAEDGFLSDVAVTPQGDRVLMTDSQSGGLYLLAVGASLPAEWTLLSGQVAPLCVGEPPHRAVLLGEIAVSEGGVPATNTVLSQVVPIAPGCPYELAFDGIATDDGAVAEVLWRGSDCAAAGTVAVAIPVLSQNGGAEIVLQPARLRLSPPANTAQAEVRFRVPFGAAFVAAASLRGIDSAVANPDLRAAAGGPPEGWIQAPAAAPGFSILPAGGAVRLRNSGSQSVALSQEISLPTHGTFVLELRGRSTTVAEPRAVPALELRWLAADGAAAAPATVLEVRPESFDGLAAAGPIPSGATRAELRLAIPSGATLDVGTLGLRFPALVEVPVTFVAESPGELTLLDWQIAYEEREAPPPAVPASGLCNPTPAGGLEKAGEECCGCGHEEGESCFCPCCQAERPLANPQPAVSAAGRPAVSAACPTCGAELILSGGRPQPGAPIAAGALAVVPGGSRRPVGLAAPAAATPATLPVTRIPGIGRGRARALRAAGMDSLETVATSSPATLRRLLRGVSEEAAAGFIVAARDLLR